MPTDLSQLSNEELLALAGMKEREENNPLASLSDEQLLKMYHGKVEKDKVSPNENNRSLGKESLRQVGRAGRSLATGITGIFDIPNLAAMGLHAAGLKEDPEFYPSPSRYIQEKIDTLTGGKLKPENKAEEYMDIITEGAAPAILTGGVGLAGHGIKSAAKQIGKRLTGKGAAANVGSSVAAKHYIDTADNPSMLGILASSYAGGKGAKILRNPKNSLQNTINSTASGLGTVTGFSPEKYKQQKSLNIPVSLGSVSKYSLPNYLEIIAGKTPGSMAPLEKFHLAREGAIAKNLGISTPNDLEHAVSNPRKYLAKEGAEAYHNRASKHYQKRSEKFAERESRAIENKELADISDVMNKLEHERSRYINPDNFDKSKNGILLRDLKKSVPPAEGVFSQKNIDKLRAKGYSQDVIDKLIKADNSTLGSAKQKIGYKDLNHFREKALQESIATKTPLGGSTPESRAAAERSHLLSEARHKNMEKIGNPSEVHNAREARLFWSRYRNEENGMAKYVEKLTGAENDATAFKKLTQSTPKYLNVVRQGLPKQERPKLLESIISDAGERQGRFNINHAHSKFTSWEAPVKEELTKLLPTQSAQENFSGTMKYIGENKRAMERLVNTSNTAHSNAMIDLLKKYGAATAGVATGAGLGGFIPLAITYAGAKLGAHMWTNQTFLKRINDAITAKTPRSQANHIDLAMKSITAASNQSTYNRKADEKKKLHIMMTPSKAYKIN